MSIDVTVGGVRSEAGRVARVNTQVFQALQVAGPEVVLGGGGCWRDASEVLQAVLQVKVGVGGDPELLADVVVGSCLTGVGVGRGRRWWWGTVICNKYMYQELLG